MIDAKMVREIASKYIYDRCPAIVGVGKEQLVLLFRTGNHAPILVARVLLRIFLQRSLKRGQKSLSNLNPCYAK